MIAVEMELDARWPLGSGWWVQFGNRFATAFKDTTL